MADAGAGPRGRHKRTRRHSGVIQARYALIAHPLGGYGEVALRAGDSPISLPYIEIDPSSLQGRVRSGVGPSEVHRLVEVLKEQIRQQPDPRGQVYELDVFTDDLHEIGKDPEFWPRIVLGPSGKLFIRARSPEEATKFFHILWAWIVSGGYEDGGTWQNTEVLAGTIHRVAIRFDTYLVQRVLAKIPCALAMLRLGAAHPALQNARDYVVGRRADEGDHIVREICAPTTLDDWPNYHVSAVILRDKKLMGIVSVQGSLHTVDLGDAPDEEIELPIVARSSKDGSWSELVEGREAAAILDILLRRLTK